MTAAVRTVGRPAGDATAQLLEVSHLTVRFSSPSGEVRAVEDVSFSIRKGESIGIVGESGSGKTVTCLSLTWLLPSPPARYVSGKIVFDGTELSRRNESLVRKVRGRRIAMIFQNSRSTFDPSYRIGSQFAEVLRIHRGLSWREARPHVIKTIRSCNVLDPEGVLDRFPHQVSGGVAQRAAIALALLVSPDILIADEPTTALDLLTQLEVLMLLERVRAETGASIIVVSHDLSVVKRIADRILIMYAGRIVEDGPCADLFARPQHPYTQALLSSAEQQMEAGRLLELPGQPPDLSRLPRGCSFNPRCRHAFDRCYTEVPELYSTGAATRSRCFLSEKVDGPAS